MLGEVTGVRIGNQKLISVDSIALFGIIGLLAAIGAILTHKFQTDESAYISNFSPLSIPLMSVTFNTTCDDAGVECFFGYTIDSVVDCTSTPISVVCVAGGTTDNLYGFESYAQWYSTVQAFNLESLQNGSASAPFFVQGYVNNNNPGDYRLFYNAICSRWCADTDWMYKLCVAVAGLCVGFSGLVFLYLYLGCILERLYPKRRLQRLANLLLMQGEEPPKLERAQTSSKSESIRPDLKEY